MGDMLPRLLWSWRQPILLDPGSARTHLEQALVVPILAAPPLQACNTYADTGREDVAMIHKLISAYMRKMMERCEYVDHGNLAIWR